MIVVVLFLFSVLAVEFAKQAKGLLAFYDETNGVLQRNGWSRSILQDANASALWCFGFEGISCSSSLAVVSVELRNFGLYGVWSDSLIYGLNDSLQTLDLGVNNLSGDLEQSLGVPCSIASCPSIQTLLIDENPLLSTHDLNALSLPTLFPNLESFQIGPSDVVDVRNATQFLDTFFRRLPNLNNLEISDIYFHGDGAPIAIPPSLCNATALRSLQLNAVALRGAIPLSDCWNRLSNLISVDLSENFLSGGLESNASLESSLLCAHPTIQYVELSHNRLNGTICSNFSAPNLHHYLIRNNSLSSSLPNSLALCSNLVTVDFANNRFNSTVPSTLLSTLPHDIVRFDLSNNQLTGWISFEQLDQTASSYLQFISIAGNPLMQSNEDYRTLLNGKHCCC